VAILPVAVAVRFGPIATRVSECAVRAQQIGLGWNWPGVTPAKVEARPARHGRSIQPRRQHGRVPSATGPA